MVTTGQIFRGAGRTMRAIDREAKRSQARRVAYERAAQKVALLEEAEDAFHQYEVMIGQLVGAHRIPFFAVDWDARAQAVHLDFPEPQTEKESAARRRYESYRPNWFERTFGLAKTANAKLEAAILTSADEEASAHAAECDAVRTANADIEFAKRMVALDRDAIVSTVNNISGLGDLPFCLEALDLFFTSDDEVVARVDGLDVEDMPTQSITLLQSGKASIRALSQARILELHQANICSSALRIGMELLRVIPIASVEVVMETDMLDPATGHIESLPVLSVKIARQAIQSLSLERTEAPAVVQRLGAEMVWNSRRGFQPIADG